MDSGSGLLKPLLSRRRGMNAPREAIQDRDLKSSLGLAILLIVLGLLAIALPVAASISVVRVLAWLVLFDGVAQLIYALRSEGIGSLIWKLLVALLYLAAGVYLLTHPLLGLSSLTFMLAVFFFAEGIMDMFTYFFTRGSSGSNWLLPHGAVTFVLGLMIWRRWPFSSLWAIGTLVGISMLLTGMTRLMMAMEARKLAKANG
jgi:uncharacterized membrane protein HdeD (DUF308 family)